MNSAELYATWLSRHATMLAKLSDVRWCVGLTLAVAALSVVAAFNGEFVMAGCLLITATIIHRITWMADAEYRQALDSARSAYREYQDRLLWDDVLLTDRFILASGVFRRNGSIVEDSNRGQA